jgi:calcium-translocating P-type ATPase
MATPAPPPVVLDPEERLDQLLADLGTRRDGLSRREAERRLAQHGRNEVVRREAAAPLRALIAQFTHPLALLLWVAAGLAWIGAIEVLAAAIVMVIVLNAGFAWLQERQAERATEALQEYLPPHARVRRDGRVEQIDARDLVPGDILLLEEGERLSADARLVRGDVQMEMAALTGESQPVDRSARRSAPSTSPLESDDLVFSGTLCVAGEAEAVVYATAMSTQLGRIAALSQRVRPEPSPLQREVDRAARLIAAVAVLVGAVFLLIGTLVAGLPVDEALTFAIGLLVANVPEGLLPIITLALAVGVRRMARRRALLKRLTAVETLGSTDVICTDKTGTLTEGTMAPRLVWVDGREFPLDGHTPELPALARALVRCSNATIRRDGNVWRRSGDPTETALLLAAVALGEDPERAQAEREERRTTLFAFDGRRKRMSTVDREDDGRMWVHTKGAPLELLDQCAAVLGTDGTERLLDARSRRSIVSAFERYAGMGLRVLGVARRPAPADEGREAAETELTFLGLVALEDPPRPGVAEAVARCHQAGIRTLVITGDHGLTAAAVASRVGITGSAPTVVTGPEIDALPETELDELLRSEPRLIVARSTPETKLRIVDALRAEGHTVAMTGDGVNDAPALQRADIGIAMGASGTEVARESATMVLMDDSFASIVAAIEEGRVVFENLRKFVTYIFAHSTPEVVPFLLFALSGGAIPLPITAVQILAIDLGTETLPALALGREPAEPGIMDRPPRARSHGLLDRRMLTRAWLWLGLLEAVLVCAGFLFVLLQGGWELGDDVSPGSPLHATYLAATSMTFAGITACQVGTALACRTTHASLRSIGFASNRLLLWGIAFELAFAAALIYFPPLQDLFGMGPLGPGELAILAVFPVIVWGSDELRRAVVRRNRPDSSARGDIGAQPAHAGATGAAHSGRNAPPAEAPASRNLSRRPSQRRSTRSSA